MNIYLISQSVNNDYDTFSEAVVVAESEAAARLIHPNGFLHWSDKLCVWADENGKDWRDNTWATPKDVIVEKLGVSDSNVEGVISASFHAG